MKTPIARVVRSICLSITFVVVIFSLFAGRSSSIAYLRAHAIAGAVLLIGSAVHIATNTDWIRMAFSQPSAKYPRRIRQLRAIDTALFVPALLCGITGGLRWLPLPMAVLEPIAELHRISGLLMSLLLVVHLVQHRSWLVSTLRHLRRQRQPASLSVP